MRPPATGPKFSPKQSKQVSIPVALSLADLPKAQWLDLTWEIVWSEFKPTTGAGSSDYSATTGSVKLWLAGKTGLTIQLTGFGQRKLKL